MKPRLMPWMMKLARCVLYGLLLMWISACHGSNTVTTNLVGYNHTDKDIGHFTVDGNEGGFCRRIVEVGNLFAALASLTLGSLA
ncbi:hypothetical protein ACFOHQ_10865 [Xanthomonas fragariae]